MEPLNRTLMEASLRRELVALEQAIHLLPDWALVQIGGALTNVHVLAERLVERAKQQAQEEKPT